MQNNMEQCKDIFELKVKLSDSQISHIFGTTELAMLDCSNMTDEEIDKWSEIPELQMIPVIKGMTKKEDLEDRIMAEKFYIDDKLLDREILAAIKSAYNDYEDGEIIEAKRTLKAIVKAIEAFERNYEG